VIIKARKKQCTKISHIKEGDANTCFFHLRANDRRRKNFIQQLREGRTCFFKHSKKQQLVRDHYEKLMCEPPPRNRDFSWDNLVLPSLDLTSLDCPFSHNEVWRAICLVPQDKALVPNGFT
jgi:hypothetical protein